MGRGGLERKSCVKLGWVGFASFWRAGKPIARTHKGLTRPRCPEQRESLTVFQTEQRQEPGARDRGRDPNSLSSYPTLAPREASLPGMVPPDLWQHWLERFFGAGSSRGSLLLTPDGFHMSFLGDAVSVKSNTIWDVSCKSCLVNFQAPCDYKCEVQSGRQRTLFRDLEEEILPGHGSR